MGFEVGHKKLGGRKAGTKNNTPSAVADGIIGAYEELGGKKYLVEVARKYPAVFLALLGKLLPKNVNLSGQDGNALEIRIRGYKGDDN